MKTVFETKDGKTFATEADAEKHESELFESWLASQMILSSFVGTLDTEDGQEWRGWSDQKIVKDYLRKYWEEHMPRTSQAARVAEEGFRITGDGILNHLRSSGLPVPDSAEIVVRIPGGGDWSNMDLELNDEPLIVRNKRI